MGPETLGYTQLSVASHTRKLVCEIEYIIPSDLNNVCRLVRLVLRALSGEDQRQPLGRALMRVLAPVLPPTMRGPHHAQEPDQTEVPKGQATDENLCPLQGTTSRATLARTPRSLSAVHSARTRKSPTRSTTGDNNHASLSLDVFAEGLHVLLELGLESRIGSSVPLLGLKLSRVPIVVSVSQGSGEGLPPVVVAGCVDSLV